MSTEEKKDTDKKKSKDEKSKLDRELDKTFPASDPPSHTRPGSGDDSDDK